MTSPVDPAHSATWPWLDVLGTVNLQPRWWRLLTEARPAAEEPTTGPAIAGADALARALDALGVMPEVPCEGLAAVDLIELRAASLVDALGGRRSAPPGNTDHIDAIHLLVDRLVTLMHVAGRAAVAASPPPRTDGTVHRVSRGGGGVPKGSVEAAAVTVGGVIGDSQADRVNHGRPWQALCLWSLEAIERLRAEGHPVAPGTCGENLTLAGVDLDALRPGVRINVGDDLVAEVSGVADPCRTIADSFTDRRFDRIDHAKHPGWSRIYAWVIEPGEARTGARVTLS